MDAEQHPPPTDVPAALWPLVVILAEIAARVARREAEEHALPEPNAPSLDDAA